MGGAKGVVRGLMSGEIQFGNMAAPAPLRANLKGEADVVFLTGGINQQFHSWAGPASTSRTELAGKKIGFVGDGGINDALVKFVIAKLDAAGIKGLHEETIAPWRRGRNGSFAQRQSRCRRQHAAGMHRRASAMAASI